ncbi:MAG: cytochrome b/b6 domain-containing protein [Betaproteobacteria bacterium]|nr:cytochrome b/b6 domain-containing protein [Betaproteobacteria bacterium]
MSDRAGVSVRVWDVPTRLFHWTLLLLVVASVVTGKFDSVLGPDTLEWHKRSGLAILALLLFRLAWGFAGGTHARFASFLRGPRAVIGYAKGLVAGRTASESAGHNPLGGWSVVAMLAALAVQAATGLFLVQEDYGFEGPLARHVSRAVSDRLNAIHEANFIVIAVLVAMHLAAVVYYTVAKRQGLVGAMLTGRKRLEPGREAEISRGGGALVAVALAIASAAAVWALVAVA